MACYHGSVRAIDGKLPQCTDLSEVSEVIHEKTVSIFWWGDLVYKQPCQFAATLDGPQTF